MEYEANFEEFNFASIGSWNHSMAEIGMEWHGQGGLFKTQIVKDGIPQVLAFKTFDSGEIYGPRVTISNQLSDAQDTRTVIYYDKYGEGQVIRFVSGNELRQWRRQSNEIQQETGEALVTYLTGQAIKKASISSFGSTVWGAIDTNLTQLGGTVSDLDQLVSGSMETFTQLTDQMRVEQGSPLIQRLSQIVERKFASFDPKPAGLDIFVVGKEFNMQKSKIEVSRVGRLSFRPA